MSRGEQVLTEIGIDRWRLRGRVKVGAVELETARPETPTTINAPSQAMGLTETSIDWQVLIRNYRTVATLQLSKERQDPDLVSQLNQVSDDIGQAVNAMATKPLLQSQLFSTSGEQVLDATKAPWVSDLPKTVLVLAGQCPELIALIEQVWAQRAQGSTRILQVPDLFESATAVERKARLWQQLSLQGS